MEKSPFTNQIALTSWENLPPGLVLMQLYFQKNGQTGYVSNQNANTVSVINVKSHMVTTNIAVGKKPNGMVWRAN
ncbi:MAG: hypothetical protein C0508_00640 [Cyanobacteria bacterium PR.023]|nr:hypothetical protein [Cyanobacteria bacterium PR.023]